MKIPPYTVFYAASHGRNEKVTGHKKTNYGEITELETNKKNDVSQNTKKKNIKTSKFRQKLWPGPH